MAMPPICSIIIPTRDCLMYLPAALESIDAQGVADLEIIVVDDGSGDGSGAWLAERARTDPRLSVLPGPGRGPSAARNLAIEHAAAELVAFLDADDTWRPGQLPARLAYHSANPDVAFSFADYMHIDPRGGIHGTCFQFWPSFRANPARTRGTSHLQAAACRRLPNAASVLLAENVVGTSTAVARRTALQDANGFATDLASASDWDLWLRLASSGPVAFSDTVAADYLMRPGSVSRDTAARLAALEDIVRRHATRAGAHRPAPWAVRHANARILTARAEAARRRGDRFQAVAAHAGAALLAPSLRAWRALASDAAALLQPAR